MRLFYKYQAKHYFLALLPLILFSCRKQEISSPDFDVTIDKNSFAVGEPLTFNFTGNADIISFYSGVPGREYKYNNRFRIDGKPQMQFTSYYQSSTQTGTLQLLVSKDFSGTYDLDNVQKATWTDLTSRATLSTGADNIPSGVIDLSDIQTPDVPVYIPSNMLLQKHQHSLHGLLKIFQLIINWKMAPSFL